MTVAVRSMRWWDIEALMRLERELFAEDAWTEPLFWSELAERRSRYYIVAADSDSDSDSDSERVIGYAGLCVYSTDQAYVQTIGVDGPRQGAGVGTTLLRALLAEADQRGCRHVDLEVRADNARAIGIYEAHGFRSVGLRRGYYQPSGADALVMRRDRPTVSS
jgi:ribosomal-protein-alanine N-acetyltransferase